MDKYNKIFRVIVLLISGLITQTEVQATVLDGGFDFSGISFVENVVGTKLKSNISLATKLVGMTNSTIFSGTEFGSFSGLGGTTLNWTSPFIFNTVAPHTAFTFQMGMNTIKMDMFNWTYSVDNLTLKIESRGTGLLTDVNTLDTRFANFTFTSQTTPHTTSLYHSFSGTVSSVPEPDEYVMMLIGAGMLTYQIKRKQKKLNGKFV